jgi:thymidine kinase
VIAFIFGAMGSGKSAHALMTAHHRHQPDAPAQPRTAVLATTLDRGQQGVSSRTGMSAPAIVLVPGQVHADVFGDADAIIVDEAQFLAPEDVEVLVGLSNAGREVVCFGLRTDFRGELFPGARRLLEVADSVRQVPLEPRCVRCERAAVVNARLHDGHVLTAGPQVALGDVSDEPESGHAQYAPMCVRCWYTELDPRADADPGAGTDPRAGATPA